jgi:uncharacterized membrane protein (DUF4010 family)
MKPDIGMNNYTIKIIGVVISATSLAGYILFQILKSDPVIISSLTLTKLLSILFSCGLVLFLFSKDRKTEESAIQNTNLISRLFLTALYSCLIVFSLIQSLNNDYSIDILIAVMFFLIIQVIYSMVIQYRHLSNKGFYILSTVIFILGVIALTFI